MTASFALTYFEIDIPFCSLTYSVAPCTATLTGSPPTGTAKCFNSIRSCQDRPHFSDLGATLRFAVETGYLPNDIDAIPSIKAIDFTPAIISLGIDLGQRATLKVTFKDHPHSDTGPGFDKYLSERTYDPFSQGTFWGKFRARHRSLQGRACRLIRGLLGQALEDMDTRHYVIESFDGPNSEGEFSIIAKDVLKLADGDRAQAPLLSNGFLVGGIDSDDTTATLSPTGIGNEEYPASGVIAIGGKEICSFTRSGDALTLTRAQLNTVAQSHSAQDRVQLVIRYVGENPADIIHDLLVNYAGVDSGFIDQPTWQSETQAFLGIACTATIAEPTSVNTLVSELIEQAALALWWDDAAQLIRLQVLRAIPTSADRYNEDNTLSASLQITEQPDKRLTQVWTYFGQINACDRQDNDDNYRSTARVVDEDAEADYGVPIIKKIRSRWIAAGGRSVATTVGNKHLGRYRDPPRRFNLELIRFGAQIDPVLGSGYRLGGGDPSIPSWPFQDDTGARIDVPIQITRLNPDADRSRIEAEEMLFVAATGSNSPNDHYIIFDANLNNVNLRTTHDELYGTPESGDYVECTVQSGVIIGSSSVAAPAFNVGDWPAGITIKLIVIGRIQGRGGDGGLGGSIVGSTGDGHPGQNGGTALYTRHAISLDVDEGQLFGGGGGGGGGVAEASSPKSDGGDGGGGGAGQLPGNPVSGGLGASGGASGAQGGAGSTEAGGPGGNGGHGHLGGHGGGPGLAGDPGFDDGFNFHTPGAGGNPGASIDGVSVVTVVAGPGDIRGPQVN